MYLFSYLCSVLGLFFVSTFCIFSQAHGFELNHLYVNHTSQIQNQERPTLVLYYSPSCPYSQKVLRYLASIHKTLLMKNVILNPQAKEELIKKGGKAQVPCLFINDQPLYESDEIIRWLSTHKEFLNSSY